MMSRQGQVLAGWIVMIAMAVLCVGCEGGSPAPTPVDESTPPSRSVEIDQFSKDEAKAYAAKWNGRMKISGTVKDEAGKPMAGVKCATRETMMEGDGPTYRTRSRKVDGSFAFEYNQVAHVEVEFSAPGYFTESMEFEFLEPSPGVVNNNGTQEYTVHLVLTKRPANEVDLVSRRVVISVDPTGLTNEDAPPGATAHVYQIVDLLNTRADTPNKLVYVSPSSAPIETPYLCMEAIADPEAPFASRIDSLGEVQPLSPPGYRINLVLRNDPDGGFIPYIHPTKGQKYQFGFPREMQEAPPSGYTSSIEIKPEWFLHSQSCAAFYVRIGGKYGKAKISPRYDRPSKARCLVDLEIEPTGSRWVFSARD